MIPVGEKGVYNKIVFSDGKQSGYSIDYIVVIDENNETILSLAREIIYGSEYKGIPTQTEGVFKIYFPKDIGYGDNKAIIDRNLQYSNGERNGRGSDRKTQFSLKDSLGKELSKEQAEFSRIARQEKKGLLTNKSKWVIMKTHKLHIAIKVVIIANIERL